MKKKFAVIGGVSTLLLFSACTSVTETVDDAYSDMDIEFHTKAYMKKRPLKVPTGINEDNFGKLPFSGLPGFAQHSRGGLEERSSDQLSKKEFEALKLDFETNLTATNRFPVAQIRYGLADTEIRKATRNGTANATEFDSSELVEAKYIINVTISWNSTSSAHGSQNTITNKMEWNCNPVEAKNNRPIDWFPPFKIQVNDAVRQKISSTGRVLAGPRLHSDLEWEYYLMNLSKKAQVKFLNYIYGYFPAGGKVTEFSEDLSMAVVHASRATGLLADMEMVIYARRKGRPDSMRIPLFNATVNLGQTKTSELQIWRETDSSIGKKIIAKLSRDQNAAMAEYDFFAASDGLARPPEFIQIGGQSR